jgi:cysteine desulfurase
MIDGQVIYLDHAATTPLDPRVSAAMLECLGAPPGNAGSTHATGRAARARVEYARSQVASLINAPPAAIVFTSGATESDNIAILGAARAQMARGRHIVSLRTEHKAVLDPLKQLAAEGFQVTLLTPGRDGRVDPEVLGRALTAQTTLVSVMLVNNETGVLQDVPAIAAQCRRYGALLHVDAAQAAGRVPLDVQALDADLVSLAAHKIHGPAGVGALYVRREPRPVLAPIAFGGGQEGGVRPGTLPVHQIVGMGVAYALAEALLPEEPARLAALRDRLWAALQPIGGLHLNGHPTWRAPHILNVSFEGVDGEALLFGLGEVAVSSGSACSASSGEPSYVLRALGRDDALAQASIRFSLGRPTTVAEIDAAATRAVSAVARLRALAPRVA